MQGWSEKMIPSRPSPTDTERQRLRDDRLWSRELQWATQLQLIRMKCVCTKCKGRQKLLIRNVRNHLIRNGRHPHSRVWTGAGAEDSSDEEWAHHLLGGSEIDRAEVDTMVDTRGIIQQAQDVVEDGETPAERVEREVSDAFATGDSIHEEYRDADVDEVAEAEEYRDGPGPHDPLQQEETENEDFDARVLEESVEALYDGSKSSKLAATVLLMNLCIVHGVSNQCANEFFSILHLHLLPENNTLPKNYHAAKSLTMKLGLTYKTIHACEKGCMLFRGEHANALRCPKCNGRRYRNEDRRAIPLKVLRHFPIIPRLQRMFRSPKISKLMLWHAENRSDREGGDGLV